MESPPNSGNAGISIHAPRTGSDGFACNLLRIACHISIHAPRTGSDAFGVIQIVGIAISIHAPRTGSDQLLSAAFYLSALFQSTLPARGATRNSPPDEGWKRFQSTLPARGATRYFSVRVRQKSFQSTLPARGATLLFRALRRAHIVFQSTLPARGATRNR